MLDVELNLVSELVVVCVSCLELEIDEEAEVIVESEKIILLVLVLLEDLLEVWCIGSLGDISRSTVEAVTIHRGEWLDMDSLLFTDDSFVVVYSSTVITVELVLLDSNHYVVGKTDMDKRVHTTAVLLEHLSLLDVSWEIGKDESISTSVGESQKLKSNTVFDLLINISVIKHFFDLHEKWVIKFFGFSSKLRDVLHNLDH